MKNWNFTNKLYAFLLGLFFLATIVKIISYRGWERYYYGASFSAPPSYPVHVRNGYFILEDGDTHWISTEQTNYRSYSNWGEENYESPNSKTRLPTKLVLQYSSYRDTLFYSDTITLPNEAIKKAFDKVNIEGFESDIYSKGKVNHLDFMVGIANKGQIVVWLRGKEKEITLVKHQLKSHEPRKEELYYDGQRSKTDYLNRVFNIDSATQAAIEQGVDRNAKYIDTPSNFKKLLEENLTHQNESK